MAKTDKQCHNPFEDAVCNCIEIKDAYQPGITALGKNSVSVRAIDPKKLTGSVDIDKSLLLARANEPRWDYAVGYADAAYFVEVHPADTKNVDEMLNKVAWLKNWLSATAPDLKKLHKCGVFNWIPSGRVRILKTSTQYKKISANNLTISKILKLG